MSSIDSTVLERLRGTAQEAAARAYAPYSNFHVGAALLFDDGSVVAGCNVENVSYGLTSCAERNALFRAVSERGPGPKIVAIAVTNAAGAACPPCGACRQVMAEFVTADAVVTFPGERGWETMPFAQIFPSSFHFVPEAR
ncbi:MAG TPA: cytidine deaminase [Acidobacteriaceae bacterium]|nr:cytidine deaminase [Acidobacteriaceae bacterium]